MLNTQDYIKKEVNELQIEQHNVLAQELISVIDDNDSEEEKIRKINDLIDKGANVNFHDANRSNDTPLHTATRKGEAKIVELLIARGALISNKNTQNNTPLELAINLNKQDIVQILRKVDINELQIDNVDNEKEDLIKAFELFKEIFPYGSDNLEDYLRKRRLLPRIEALLLQMDNWIASHPLEKKTIEENYIVSLLMWICDGYAHTWNPKKNKELLERALAIEEEHYGRDHLEIAITLGNLSNAYGALGDHQKKKQLLERALAIEEEHYGRNHFEVARTLGNLGNVYAALGDFNKQKELLARALAIEEEHYGRDHLEIAITLGNLSNAYGALGDFNKQKELLEWTLAIFEKHYGHDHLEVAVTFGNLGNAYGDLGNHQKKKELLEKALPILEKHYGRNHSEVAITLGNLGNAYGALGDPQKKKQLLEWALTIQERHYGCDHAEVARILVNLGNVYGALGDPNKQKELLEQALPILEKHYGRNHFGVMVTLINLGNAYGALGNPQKQKELLEQTLPILEKHYGRDHFEVARTLGNLGNTYGDLGDHQKQKQLLERALPILKEHYGANHQYTLTAIRSIERAQEKISKFNIQQHSTQEEAFLNLFKFTSNNMPNIKIQSVKQGLYLPSFLARAVEIDGKCIAITRMFSQALLFDLTSDPVLAEQFLKNMESSAELYERLAQGKQISAREERDVFDFSRMLDDFEQQFNSPTSSLPSFLSHMKSYKTPADLSKFMYELSGNCALHLVTSNHVVAIYKTGDTYAYFDTNVAFISGIQTISDLMKVVEKGVEFAGYELEPEGFLVEYFDVTRANHELTEIQKEILRDPIQTERHLLSLQDQNLGLLNINGKEISRVTLYDIGTKVNVADGVPILINAEMNLNSEKVINHLNKGELSITAREYLNNLKNGGGQEVIDAPFIGSSREVKNAEQARKFMALSPARELTNYEPNNLLKSPAVMSGNGNMVPKILYSRIEEAKLEPEVARKISSTLIDALLANVSPLEGQTKHLPYLPETTNAPQTYLNSIAIRTLLCYGRTI